MDFLIDNPLTNLAGPAFLVLFISFSVLVLIAQGLFKSYLDRTDQLSVPAIPPEIDPYEVAYLRGGPNELARSLIFSLVQKELVEFEEKDSVSWIKKTETSAENVRLTTIESIAYSWIGTGREAPTVFDAKIGLVKQIEQYTHKYDIDLSNRQFLMPEDVRSRAKRYAWIAGGLIASVGIYKVVAAIIVGNFNVAFTIFIVIFGFAIAMSIGKTQRVTKLGKQYLDRLNIAFSDLKYRAQAPYIGANAQRPAEAGQAGIDPLLLSVGIFGTGILAGTAFSGYNDTFARAQQQQGGWGGGGCGSSCGSSCSSSDGGSSCGSSCGGGCGGCS